MPRWDQGKSRDADSLWSSGEVEGHAMDSTMNYYLTLNLRLRSGVGVKQKCKGGVTLQLNQEFWVSTDGMKGFTWELTVSSDKQSEIRRSRTELPPNQLLRMNLGCWMEEGDRNWEAGRVSREKKLSAADWGLCAGLIRVMWSDLENVAACNAFNSAT